MHNKDQGIKGAKGRKGGSQSIRVRATLGLQLSGE